MPKVPGLLPTQQTGSNFGTKQREKSGMGLEMVAERPRALKKYDAGCSEDIIIFWIMCAVLFFAVIKHVTSFTNHTYQNIINKIGIRYNSSCTKTQMNI